MAHYVKVAFFRGTSLRPLPPGASKGNDTRHIDIHEGDKLDEAQMAKWAKQAAALPGGVPWPFPLPTFAAHGFSGVFPKTSLATPTAVTALGQPA